MVAPQPPWTAHSNQVFLIHLELEAANWRAVRSQSQKPSAALLFSSLPANQQSSLGLIKLSYDLLSCTENPKERQGRYFSSFHTLEELGGFQKELRHTKHSNLLTVLFH